MKRYLKKDWLRTDAGRDNNVRLVKGRCQCHNAFAITASSEKTVFAFDFFDTLHVLKSCNDA